MINGQLTLCFAHARQGLGASLLVARRSGKVKPLPPLWAWLV